MVKCSNAENPAVEDGVALENPLQRQRIQMVLLRESGMAQHAIAAAMGVSLSTLNRAQIALPPRRDQSALSAGRLRIMFADEAPGAPFRPMPGTPLSPPLLFAPNI
jgi:Homeodomain-like domain-containing protein